MNTYTTVLGDTWDAIAFNVYGNEKYAKELVEANLKYIETVTFSAGTVLTIPELSEADANDYSLLPPWKRGA